MPEYLIEHRIGTLAELYEPFDYEGFKFRQWHHTGAEGPTGQAWIAKRSAKAADVQQAINEFRTELFPVVDKVAFVSQCFAAAEMEPFSILKAVGNDDRVLFFRWARQARGVPLAFGEEEMSSLVALDKYQKRGEVFDRMREAINSTTFSGRFPMLASALEAIAGQKTLPKGRLTTDRDYIANEVLQDEELCRSIFGYGGGIRNQLLHGIEINLDQHGGVDYVTRIYDSIVRYFNQKHGTQIETHVKEGASLAWQ